MRPMTRDLANAIAASAYNVCGPQVGAAATPATVHDFDRAVVANALSAYVTEHDGDLYSAEEIRAARDAFV